MANFRLVFALLLLGSIVINAKAQAQAPGPNISAASKDPLDTVLLQGFNWESWESSNNSSWYNVLKGIVDDAAEAGITDVWFPPPSHSVTPQGYMPGKLYDLDSSRYGNQQQLKDTVAAFHQKGIGCVGDMVINHRCGTKKDDKGMWRVCVFEGGKGDGSLDWDPWAVTVNDKNFTCGSGQNDTGADYEGAPDIDHTNPKIQQDLSDWMNWLKSDVGFDGWRFDFAKGYAGNLLGAYIQNTNPKFAVGEVWDDMSYSDNRLDYDQSAHRQRLVDWVNSTGDRSSAFDFTTKGILQEAVKSSELWRLNDSNGKPAGMIGVLPQKAVTFIDNHDTVLPNHWPFPSDKLLQGYAYILTHPGIPTIFYDHFVDGNLKKGIQDLIALRKRNNINANSSCRIITAEEDLYMAAIDEKIVMKIGARYDVGKLAPPSPEFRIVAYGNDYCVWEKKSSSG